MSRAVLPEVLPRVHPSSRLGILQRSVERGVELGPLLGGQVIIDHDDFDLCSVWQASGPIHNDAAVPYVSFQGEHARILARRSRLRTGAC